MSKLLRRAKVKLENAKNSYRYISYIDSLTIEIDAEEKEEESSQEYSDDE